MECPWGIPMGNLHRDSPFPMGILMGIPHWESPWGNSAFDILYSIFCIILYVLYYILDIRYSSFYIICSILNMIYYIYKYYIIVYMLYVICYRLYLIHYTYILVEASELPPGGQHFQKCALCLSLESLLDPFWSQRLPKITLRGRAHVHPVQ